MKVKNFAIKVDKKDVNALVKDMDKINKLVDKIEKRNLGKSLVTNDTSKNVRDTAANLATMNKETAKAAANIKKLTKELDDEKKSLEKVTKSTDKSTHSFAKFAKSALIIFGVGNAIAFLRDQARKAVKDTAEFNRQVRIAGLISSDGKDAAANTEALRQKALSVGGKTEYTAKQVADLEVAYGKLGFTASETLNLIATTADAATVSQEDLGLTAEVVGNAIHAFGLETADAGRVADVMAKSFTSSALNLEKFKVGISTAGSSARASNVSLEKTVAMLGVLSDAGFEASKAATSLRNILLKSQLDGRNYGEVLDTLVGTHNSLAKSAELFGRRAAAAAVILALEKDSVTELNKKLIESQGFSEKTAEQIRNDLQGSLDKLKSGWDNISITLTTKAAPAIKGIVDDAIELEDIFLRLVNNQAQVSDEAVKLENTMSSIISIGESIYSIFTDIGVVLKKAASYIFGGGTGALSVTNISVIAAAVKDLVHNLTDDVPNNVFDNLAGGRLNEIALKKRADDTIKLIKQGKLGIENLAEYERQLKSLEDKLVDADDSKVIHMLEYRKGLIEKIISAFPNEIANAQSALDKSIKGLISGWKSELANIQELSVGKAENIANKIQGLLEADNKRPEDSRMSKSLRKQLQRMFLQIGDYIDKQAIDTYNKISAKIKSLKEAYYNTFEGDFLGRAKIEKEIRLLEARLDKLKFPPIPIKGLINIARDNISELNKQLQAAETKKEIADISKSIFEAKKNLKDLELIQKRINAKLDPNRTGVLKEDIQAKLDANERTFLKQQADILNSVEDSDKQSALLRGAKLEKERQDLLARLTMWKEHSVKYDEIVSKIQAVTKKGAANTEALKNSQELLALKQKFVSDYTSETDPKVRAEIKYKYELAELEKTLKQEQEKETVNADKVADIKIKIADKVAAHEKKLKDEAEKQDKERIKRLLDFVDKSISALNDIGDAIYNFGEAQDNRETDRITRHYDARIKAAKGNADAIARLEEEKDKKLKAIQKRAFERQKKLDIASAIISGSQAILSIWAARSTLRSPLDVIVKGLEAAAVAAKTASEIARIRTTTFAAAGGYTGKGRRAPDHTGERPTQLVQLHEAEWVMPRKDLETREGAALAHAGETLRTTGKMDLSLLMPFIPQSGGTAISDSQLEQFAIIVSNATIEGLKAHAAETEATKEMYKRAM